MSLAAASPTPAQGPGDSPLWLEPLLAECRQLLEDRTPELRGEAALILACSGQPEHHTAILAVSRDPQAQARIRGILALGILAAPGAEARLGTILNEASTRLVPDAVAAALAIGLLPEGHPAYVVEEYLAHFRRSNYRRHRDALAAMLVGLSQDVRQSKVTPLRILLEDDANKDPVIRALLIHVLSAVPGALSQEEISELLSSTVEEELCAVLAALARSDGRLPSEHVAQIERLAARDRSPKVRAAALDCLTARRHVPALELFERALRSPDPREAAAAARAAVELGGGTYAEALEAAVVAEPAPEVQAALLTALTGYRSDHFLRACADLALDDSRPVEVRARAAAAAAAMGETTMGPTLHRLFLDAEDPGVLELLAHTLVRVAPDSRVLDDIHPPSSPEDLARLADRLYAMAAAGHPDAFALLLEAMRGDTLDPVTKADLLAAWRRASWPLLDPAEIAMLPDVLRGLLQ